MSGDAGSRRIGPFVEPGRTACLRCVDAHEAEVDPRLPFLVEQAAMATDGGEPVDPVLDRLALAWAVRDLCRYLEGDEPSTWSATVDLGPTDATAPGALAAAPALRLCLGPAVRPALTSTSGHHQSLSSLLSMARRCSREQVSQ